MSSSAVGLGLALKRIELSRLTPPNRLTNPPNGLTNPPNRLTPPGANQAAASRSAKTWFCLIKKPPSPADFNDARASKGTQCVHTQTHKTTKTTKNKRPTTRPAKNKGWIVMRCARVLPQNPIRALGLQQINNLQNKKIVSVAWWLSFTVPGGDVMNRQIRRRERKTRSGNNPHLKSFVPTFGILNCKNKCKHKMGRFKKGN